MVEDIKFKIIKILDGIDKENVLMQVMEDVAFYAAEKDIIDDLSASQLEDLDDAISQANNKDVIHWSDFKNEINEWRRK
ncbi:MAG TPA: hypothetical protein VFI29_04350 [Hanamia sp.]|nr:hypothetical protein [Hanamia sp.]